MYVKIRKSLIYFWATAFIIVALKMTADNMDDIIDSTKSTVKKVKTKITEKTIEFKAFKLPVKERYSIYIEDASSCVSELKNTYDVGLKDPAISNVRNVCSDGECELVVDFIDEIPESIELAVEDFDSGYCVLKRYQTGEKYKVTGYFVELDITEELKEKLGIGRGKYKIRLKNATDYYSPSASGNDKIIFNYTEKPEKDIILVNDKEKLIVRFY